VSTTASTGQTPQSGPGNSQSLFNLTKGSAYDRDEIYAHSTDTKGHYEIARVKITPSMEAEIAELVASKVRKYRTTEDFIRNAIVHQMHYELTTVRPQATPVVTAEMRMSEMNRHQALIKAWSDTITTTMETGESLLAAGALEELGDFLTRWDQDFENQDLPVVKRKELVEVLENLHDRLKRARKRDYI
jgi:Arc/MetJ-type ribon-helix-helix transcriptional regulator